MHTKPEKPELKCSRDYSIFEFHELNRPLHEDPVLFDSMRTHGFMPSSPIQVQRNGNGKLKVIRGHHRLWCARELKLPVWYVVDPSNTDIFALEGGRARWSAMDFAVGRAAAGNAHVQKVLDFAKAHGLNLSSAASLVGGENAGSHNQIKAVENGTFTAAQDMRHANAVAKITDACHAAGLSFARSSAFVAAVSRMLRVPEFDSAVFLHRVALNPGKMMKRSTSDEYLEEIEALYNYAARKTVPLAFRAIEVGRQRKATFGKSSGSRPESATGDGSARANERN